MKVFIGQIYVEVGVSFPFSLAFQKWLGEEVTSRVEWSGDYARSFTEEYKIGFRISAKKNINTLEIKGPTIFKKDKSIEFTLFLPFKQEIADVGSIEACADAFAIVLEGISQCLLLLGLPTDKIQHAKPALLKFFKSDQRLIKAQ